jgi:hypothetical protein
MPDGSNLIIGRVNTGTSTTSLQRSGGATRTAFNVDNADGIAISAGSEYSIAIAAVSESDDGVFGQSRRAAGVEGQSDEDVGVVGSSGRDVGVFGKSFASAGVYGLTLAGDSTGVLGIATSDSAGVWGFVGGASTWPGVEGYSAVGNGVRGVSIAPVSDSSVGVVGYSMNGTGIIGITDSSSKSVWGGAFIGGLMVWGPKSAAVPHPDGSHRALYCVESPESWFEDFGRAKLVRGRARVKLDRNFAAVVRTNNYHVFLSPEDETKGLYVSTRNRAGFEVREQGAGTGSARFSYRIVARRRDINPPRFAKVALPRLIGKELRNTPKAIDVAKLAKRGSAARTLPRVKS